MTQDGPTLDQRRARHAWEAVAKAKGKGKSAAEYAREAKRLPIRIRISGLGQSLAFLKAKGRAPALLADIDDWLLQERRLGGCPGPGGGRTTEGNGVLELVVNRDARLLRRATEEAMLYLQWLTRFAEAEIEIDDDSGDAG